jgi:hypothetical protein
MLDYILIKDSGEFKIVNLYHLYDLLNSSISTVILYNNNTYNLPFDLSYNKSNIIIMNFKFRKVSGFFIYKIIK